jgi:hypothetical protein
MPQFLAACLFIFVTACFGTLVSMLVTSQVYASVTVWSKMSLPQRLIVIGSPCIGALFGLVVILTSSQKRRQRAVTPAVTPAPAQNTAVGKNCNIPMHGAKLTSRLQNWLTDFRKTRPTLRPRFCRLNQENWLNSADLALPRLFLRTPRLMMRAQQSLHQRTRGTQDRRYEAPTITILLFNEIDSISSIKYTETFTTLSPSTWAWILVGLG